MMNFISMIINFKETQGMLIAKVAWGQNCPCGENSVQENPLLLLENVSLNSHPLFNEALSSNTQLYVSFATQVRVTQSIQGHEVPQEVRQLSKGEFFGEKALLRYILMKHNFLIHNLGVGSVPIFVIICRG